MEACGEKKLERTSVRLNPALQRRLRAFTRRRRVTATAVIELALERVLEDLEREREPLGLALAG